jgi:hypothetical protein
MSRQLESYGINILQLHAEWLVANGYKRQASSCKRQIRMILNYKRQATSYKRQAPRPDNLRLKKIKKDLTSSKLSGNSRIIKEK